jgi:putative addiction module component (TIGR02574 family)
MSTDSAGVLNAAMSLPEASRADLAFNLLQSLTPATGLSEDDLQFDDELERRVLDYESGQTSASDCDDVAKRVRGALEGRNAQ